MISQQQLVCDNSTLANFKQWAMAISAFIPNASMTQTADTGQVNWSTISAVPGSNVFVYEMWKSNDPLATFYFKMEYGTNGSAPSVRISVGTGTDGAGNLNAYVAGPWQTNSQSFTAPSATTQYECNFSAAAGRLCIQMWRNGTNNCQQVFGFERSVDSGGNYTGDHVTITTVGYCGGSASAAQQTLVLAVGAAQASVSSIRTQAIGGLIVRAAVANSNTTSAFNNGIGFDTISPYRGYFDYNLTMMGAVASSDVTEGVTFQATLYGKTVTYMPSFAGPLIHCGPSQSSYLALCMRYD